MRRPEWIRSRGRSLSPGRFPALASVHRQRGHLQHRHGKGGLLPDTVDYQFKGLTDGNKLAVFVMCKQRRNGSNMGRRFANGSLFLRLIAKECRRLGISYTMPAQSVTVNGGLQVLGQREAFLSEEGGK